MTAGVRGLQLSSATLKTSYEVVVIGGGVHGLSTAYHLAKGGRRDVAVLERSYLGGGASGRNLGVIRANFSTEPWLRLFSAAQNAWKTLSLELDVNVMFTPRGYLICAPDEASRDLLHAGAERQRAHGVAVDLVDADGIAELVPLIDRTQVQGGSFDRGAGQSRHDAVVWGYAQAASRLGVGIHTGIDVSRIVVENGRIAGVETPAGRISAPIVVNAAGLGARRIGATADVDIPTRMLQLEAFVTDSYEPMIDPVVTFMGSGAFVLQTSRGEFVLGSETEPAPGAGLTPSYAWMRQSARDVIRYVPRLAGVNVIRSWAGIIDITPDGAGLAGEVESCPGLYVDCGWGAYGYMLSVVTGRFTADAINTGRLDPVIRPFGYGRFATGELIPESMALIQPDHATGHEELHATS